MTNPRSSWARSLCLTSPRTKSGLLRHCWASCPMLRLSPYPTLGAPGMCAVPSGCPWDQYTEDRACGIGRLLSGAGRQLSTGCVGNPAHSADAGTCQGGFARRSSIMPRLSSRSMCTTRRGRGQAGATHPKPQFIVERQMAGELIDGSTWRSDQAPEIRTPQSG